MATEFELTSKPFFLQVDTGEKIYYDAEDFRRYTASFQRRSGVLGSSDYLVTQASNVAMTVTVNSGYANVGNYIVHMQADLTSPLTIPAAPTSGVRSHKIFLAVYDGQIAGADYTAKLLVSADTGTGAPNPAGTAGYLQLAIVTVAAGQSNVQNQHINNVAQHGGSAGPSQLLAPYLVGGGSGEYLDNGSSSGPGNFRADYNGGVIRLSGQIRKKTGDFPKDTEVHFCTMLANFRPQRHKYLTGVASVSSTGASGTLTFRLTIDIDGTMTARIPSTQSVKYLSFDGLTYHLDY